MAYRNMNYNNLVTEYMVRQQALASGAIPNAYKPHYLASLQAIRNEFRRLAVARNETRRPARAARVIQRAFKNLYYAPSNKYGTLHGRGSRKALARAKGENNTENLNRKALRIVRIRNNARRNEGQGRLVQARNLAQNLRAEYGENAVRNALNRARTQLNGARGVKRSRSAGRN